SAFVLLLQRPLPEELGEPQLIIYLTRSVRSETLTLRRDSRRVTMLAATQRSLDQFTFPARTPFILKMPARVIRPFGMLWKQLILASINSLLTGTHPRILEA